MTNHGLLEPLARFVTQTTIQTIPEDVKRWATWAIQDYVAVTMPGSQMPVAQNCLSYIYQRKENGPCILFGQRQTTNAELASLFNGSASHALDFDDVSWSTIGHPTVTVAPTAFALIQEVKGSGVDLLRAYVIGVEVMHQIARWTMPRLTENGWHTTPAYGIFGSTATACALLGATEEQTINALAIASSRASGIRANFGTQTKAVHAGLCAMAGIECARLALCGITGNPKVIESVDGFAQCLATTIDPKEIQTNIGSYWDLRENGLVFKQYPCCSGSHPCIDVWNEFIESHYLTFDDIDSIKAGVSLLGPRELNCHKPQNAVQAKFSLEYALASRIVFGPIGINSFTDKKVLDSRVQDLMNRIEMFIDPELEKLGFIGTAPIRLAVYLKDGSIHHLSNDLAQGNPEKPLTLEQRKNKFTSCLRTAGCFNYSQKWWSILESLEKATYETISLIGKV